MQALLRFAPEKTWIHAFTDGRDVSPTSAVRDLAELPLDRIATVVGRYYAMDRDKPRRADAEGVRRHRRAVAARRPLRPASCSQQSRASYAAGVTDEFLEPICVEGTPRLEPGDTAIFFNFRPDRGRQLTRMLLDHGFDVTTMTSYSSDLDTPVVFGEQDVEHTIAEVLSEHGLRQLHAAETEKYAHVTYFFNGGREQAWPGETRLLVPSPRDVPSYDRKPEMSAAEVAQRVVGELGDGYSFCVVNFANPDMVGHTGNDPGRRPGGRDRRRRARRGRRGVTALGGVCLVTADHGNAEKMLEDGRCEPRTRRTPQTGCR